LRAGCPGIFNVMTVGPSRCSSSCPAWRAPGGAGAGGFLDRRSFQVLAVVVVACSCAPGRLLRPDILPDNPLDTRVCPTGQAPAAHAFSEWPWLPSFWLSTSVMRWAEGALTGGGFFLLVLLSQCFIFGWLPSTAPESFSMNPFGGAKPGKHLRPLGMVPKWRGRTAAWTFPEGRGKRFPIPLQPPSDVLALLVRMRACFGATPPMARRWWLLGLLGVYINQSAPFFRAVNQSFLGPSDLLLNLGLASESGHADQRFVYPQFSWKANGSGSLAWPAGPGASLARQILAGQPRALLVTLSLIVLSCHMLRMPWTAHFIWADHRDDDLFRSPPGHGIERDLSNFRETIRPKSSAASEAPFVWCSVFFTSSARSPCWPSARLGMRGETSVRWILGSWAGFALLSLLMGWMPFRLALRRIERFEV